MPNGLISPFEFAGEQQKRTTADILKKSQREQRRELASMLAGRGLSPAGTGFTRPQERIAQTQTQALANVLAGIDRETLARAMQESQFGRGLAQREKLFGRELAFRREQMARQMEEAEKQRQAMREAQRQSTLITALASLLGFGGQVAPALISRPDTAGAGG